MERSVYVREENIAKAFAYFDEDGDGKITVQNLVQVMGSEEKARELMGAVDLNGDGAISYDEFKAMMEAAGSTSRVLDK